MERFTLEIDLGNDAMQTSVDIAASLRVVADRLDNGGQFHGPGSIRDENGNIVGKWEISSDKNVLLARTQSDALVVEFSRAGRITHMGPTS